MAPSRVPQTNREATVAIAESFDELHRVLVTEHGFVEGRVPARGKPVAGFYVERRGDSLIAWSPAEVVPTEQAIGAVQLWARREGGRTVIRLRRVLPSSSKFQIGLLGTATAVVFGFGVLLWSLGRDIDVSVAMGVLPALVVPWAIVLRRLRLYRRLSEPVWSRLAAALVLRALPSAESHEPYRR